MTDRRCALCAAPVQVAYAVPPRFECPIHGRVARSRTRNPVVLCHDCGRSVPKPETKPVDVSGTISDLSRVRRVCESCLPAGDETI